VFDFKALSYRERERKVELLSHGWWSSTTKEQLKTPCVFRWYASLQGEERPTLASDPSAKDVVYRYDWAFGIAVIEGFWWDWQEHLRDESAIAVQILLEPIDHPPEALPVSATLSGLSPSRNTRGFWEQVAAKVPRAAADVAKASEWVVPHVGMVSSPLLLASSVLESQSGEKKNWFLYQFLDEYKRCPCVEWRITKNALKEYGTLLRGSLFLLFSGSNEASRGRLRVSLRPMIGYYPKDEICYIAPSNEWGPDEQLFIDVEPRDGL
jgi:hypothetical protein